MENPNLDNIVLSLLFASDEPLSARKIAAIVEDVTVADVKQAIDAWNRRADDEAWSIGIEQVAGGYRLATRAAYAPYVTRLYAGRRKFRLSRAGLETLAIVAYKQPITRAEIEAIRGVGCGSVIASLLERSLVQITGKAHVLGAPFLYGTTQEFLEYLGLNSIRDLPSLEDLEALLASEEGTGEAVEAPAQAGEAETDAAESEAGEDDAVESGEDAEAADAPAAGESEAVPAAAPVAGGATMAGPAEEPVNRPLYDELKHGTTAPDADAEEAADDDVDGYRE